MSKIRESARDEFCTVRLPGYCNFDTTTTVLAHLPGAGWALKAPDYQGAYACSGCHDVLDGRVKTDFSPMYLENSHYRGVIETQELLREKNLIAVVGES